MEHFDTKRHAARRRPFDALEAEVVRRALKHGDDPEIVDALRYVISFARLGWVTNEAGQLIDVGGISARFALEIRELLEARLAESDTNWGAVRALPELLRRTRQARSSALDHLPIDRDSLEREVTTRKLVVVSGGGGGAGYVYPGAYELLERQGLLPDLMVGTSMGALTSMFRARRLRYDPAAQIAASKQLSWAKVFRVLQTNNRYGLPATLRLYLRAALDNLFWNEAEGRPFRMHDCEIPLYIIVSGITVDALKHDLDFFEHLLDDGASSSTRRRTRSALKALNILREFLSRPDALREIVVGRDPGTEEFDVLDAAGFSAAIPGVIHYDVLRDDPHMTRILDRLYAEYGITRLGEGGMVANVPSRVGWETATSGALGGTHNAFVLALDCFAPSATNPVWYPMQQAVYLANVAEHNRYADLYLPMRRTPSPVNLVPPLPELLEAMRWGSDELEPHMPFVQAMVRPIAPLPEREPSGEPASR